MHWYKTLFALHFSFMGQLFLVLQLQGGVRVSPFKDFGVVGCYYLFEIRGGSVGHLDSVPVYNLVKGAMLWKVCV